MIKFFACLRQRRAHRLGPDDQWLSKLRLEQALIGPIKVTTSLEDAGDAESRKSIQLGFKRPW